MSPPADSAPPSAAGLTGLEHAFQALFHQPTVAIGEVDLAGRFVRVNSRWAELLGYPVAELLALSVADITHPDSRGATEENYQRLKVDGTHFVQEKKYVRKDGSSLWATVTVNAIRDRVGALTGFIAIVIDQRDERHHQALIEIQNEALHLVLTGAPLAKVFSRLIASLEKEGDVIGGVLLLDPLSRQLRHGAAPSLPEEYTHAIQGLTIGPDTWTCGAAAYHNRPVITEDIAAAAGWAPLRDLARRLDLRAAVSVPIVAANGHVLGTFVAYFRASRKPSAAELSTLAVLSKTAALAIERRRTEDSLQVATMSAVRQRRLYETVLSNTPDLVYVFNLEHRFTYANKALLTLWGRSWEDSIGRNCLELGYEPWHAELHDREIEQVIATRKPIRGDVAFNGTTGRRTYDYIFTPVIGSRGEVEAIAGTTRDVTDQRKAEETVRFLADLAQVLALENDEHAIIRKAVTALGSHLNAHRCYFVECLEVENRIVVSENWVRDASRTLAGSFSLDEFGGKEWWEQYSSGDFAVSDVRNNPLISAENLPQYGAAGIRSYAVQPAKRTGRWTVVMAVTEATPRVWGHDELHLLDNVAARVWPLVERARSEAALRVARDDALAASHAKDDFLAALSHELRTPLNPVLLLASEAAANPGVPAPIRADFETIVRNVSLEARLIDDLLDLTRITHNKVSLRLEPQNLHALIGQVVANAQQELNEKQLVLTSRLDAARFAVTGDDVRLQQILWNLLKNAAKFTPAGGRIGVSTSIAPSSPGFLEIAIEDTGIGLTRDEQIAIFRPFVQGEHSRVDVANPYGGLGLGLAIARRLAELHGGSIRVTSQGRGQGATFVIELPLAVDSAAPQPPAPEPLARPAVVGGTRRILLVEDHEPSRAALGQLLKNRKIEVFFAGSVAEALEQAARHPVDLVISDLGLPDGTGYDLMRELRARHQSRGVALSGYGTEADIQKSQEAGFLAHLTKPVQAHQLDRIIAAYAAAS